MDSLKYLNTHAHGRYVSPPKPVPTPREFSGRVTIRELSDNALLNVFRYYLDVSPRHWPRLVHICRRWRRIVFTSQRTLHLRVFCTHGTPVLKTLRCWPTMPIVVQYGGYLELGSPDPKDKVNIMAALKQPGRVGSISLTVPSSLLEKLSSIKTPFSELEDLVLLSQDGVPLTLSSTFRWSPRLGCLHSTRIAIPALLQLLNSFRNLVDFQLHEVFDSWQLPPEAFMNALSRMTQLQSLSLHSPATTDYRATMIPQHSKRAVLPVLTRLDFRGVSRYLEQIVARIDAPSLGNIEFTFLNQVIGFTPLVEFIDRIEIHKSHRRAHILSSERAISISLIRPGAPPCLKLQLFCKSSSKQLSFITRFCVHSSAFLFNVEDLRISTTQPSGRGDSTYSGWLDLLNLFTGVKLFHLDGSHWTNVVRGLQLPDRRRETVLPALHKLYIPQLGPRHEPLPGPVVTFMTSRRLSGHPIGVEYERLGVHHAQGHDSQLCGTGPLSQQVTIKLLSDDVLLNIFRHCLDATLRSWPGLAHVCQGWRQIVFTSTLSLDLRLYCTYGTPVLKTLECWPPFPLVVNYGGSPGLEPPALEDEDNIMAALKRSDRVGSISLTVTHSLLENLSTIHEPFLELEELNILSQDKLQPTLPSAFRWGPRLRTLHLTGIAIPSLPRLLSPSTAIVDIQLHEIPSAGYFSPEAFANALSEMTHLRTLSLHFLSFPPRRNYLGLPPLSGERVVLPTLTHLKYRGTSKYLDGFVARIDAPGLRDIDITFFSQPTMDASELGRFIDRIESLSPLHSADVLASERSISISFTQLNAPIRLEIRISCNQLDWQVSSMTQICHHFSPFLFRVEYLNLNATQPLVLVPSELGHVDGERWLGLIHAFGGAKNFRVAGEHTTGILLALGPTNGDHPTDITVLPALRNLRVQQPMAINTPLWDAVQSFISPRQLSDRPIELNVSCHICNASFTWLQELKRHFVDKHYDDYEVFGELITRREADSDYRLFK